jgi:hypothetical protein
MIWSKHNRRSRRVGSMGMELAGALSVASQMALLCPPGFDEVVRRELAGEGNRRRISARPAARDRRPWV